MLTIDVSRRQVTLLTPTIQYIMSIRSSLSMLRFLTTAGVAPLLPLKGIRGYKVKENSMYEKSNEEGDRQSDAGVTSSRPRVLNLSLEFFRPVKELTG